MKNHHLSRSLWHVLLVILFLVTIGLGSKAVVRATAPISISSPYLTVTVNSTGVYTIIAQSPAWTFGGKIGHTLNNITINSGSDGVGTYQEIDFNYIDSNNASRGGGIRAYNSNPIVLFVDSYLSTTPNTTPFPKLSTYPKNLYHLNYQYAFAQYTFTKFAADSPWVYFDGQGNTFILSPASNFMIASTTKSGSGSISSGINTTITTLPAGFVHQTFLVIGQGINTTLQTWGHAMTNLQGKTRPANDDGIVLNTLGYWTDHGATYYYNYDPNLGYAGTLQAVYNSFKQAGIPLGYMQLDGWWYPKGASDIWSNHNAGIYTYNADPTLFHNGLAAFQQQLGIPLMTQAKYIDASSPYRSQYTMSNNVSTDPNYWNMVENYLQSPRIAQRGYEG